MSGLNRTHQENEVHSVTQLSDFQAGVEEAVAGCTPPSHSHVTSEITGLNAGAIGAATASHTHSYEPANANIQTHISATAPHNGHALSTHTHSYEPANANIQSHISAVAPHSGHALSTHTHAATAINSGTLALAQLPTGVKTKGIAFCMISPATDSESARYIVLSDITLTEVRAISTSAPSSAITIKLYKNAAVELASFSHSTTSTTNNCTDANLAAGDVLYAKISGAVNGVTNITVQATVVDR